MENQISEQANAAMKGAAIWMKVLSVAGIVVFGLLTILSLLGITTTPVASIIMFVMLGAAVFSYVLVLKAGTKFSAHSAGNNEADLISGFNALKAGFLVWSILFILTIGMIAAMFAMGWFELYG